jgi:hypothetical protein
MATSAQTDHKPNLPTDLEYTAHWMNHDWIVKSSDHGPHPQDILRFQKTAEGRKIEIWRLQPIRPSTPNTRTQLTLALFDVWATGCTWQSNSLQPILQGTTRDGSCSFVISRDVDPGTHKGILTCTMTVCVPKHANATCTADVWVASEGGSGAPGEPGTPPKAPPRRSAQA